MKYIVNGKEVSQEEWSAGCEGRLQEMLAAQQPPQSKTDREFLYGLHEQFAENPQLGNMYKRIAESYGQNVTGKKYLSSLAAFPGDPRAWVDGRGDVARVCEDRGWNCEGDVKVKGRPEDASGPYRVANDIVQNRAEDLLDAAVERGERITIDEALNAAREQLSPDLTPRPIKVD